jgi:dTMP kinase
MQKRSLFLTFEGMDGSGQDHADAASGGAAARAMGRTCWKPRSRAARDRRQDPPHPAGWREPGTVPTAELLLYFASRAQNVDEWICRRSDAAKMVLADRFTDSTLVYQGCGRGLGAETVMALDRIACRGLQPRPDAAGGYRRGDQPGKRAHARNASRNQQRDAHGRAVARLPSRGLSRVPRALAAREPERVKLVEGRAGMDRDRSRNLAAGVPLCSITSGAIRT